MNKSIPGIPDIDTTGRAVLVYFGEDSRNHTVYLVLYIILRTKFAIEELNEYRLKISI